MNVDQERKLLPGASARKEFPLFCEDEVPAYLDTAASSQKPRAVIDRISEYFEHQHANVHRGAYRLSSAATSFYEEARAKIAHFLNASSPDELIFTRGTTESINLLAYSLGEQLKAGDKILLSRIEHHSNMVPWQILARRKSLEVHYYDVGPNAEFSWDLFENKLNEVQPAVICSPVVSNAFGTLFPVKKITKAAHDLGALVVLDAAQAMAHTPLDVRELNVDFLAFSGHKMYGPTGIGGLFGKRKLLDQMEPFQGGGEMIESVSYDGPVLTSLPHKFEAGTPSIAEAIALGEAVSFIQEIGFDAIRTHEEQLFEYGWSKLSEIEGLKLYGPHLSQEKQIAVLPFNVEDVHPHDLATIIDDNNVQVRAGHHCVMPGLSFLGLQSTVRASLGVYSIEEDFDRLADGIRRAKKLLAR